MGSGFFKLPGGKIKPGEEEAEGLKRKLHSKLAPATAASSDWEARFPNPRPQPAASSCTAQCCGSGRACSLGLP